MFDVISCLSYLAQLEKESFVQGDTKKALPQADSRRFILIGHFSTTDKIKFLSERCFLSLVLGFSFLQNLMTENTQDSLRTREEISPSLKEPWILTG